MNKTISVFGGSGFIGSEFSRSSSVAVTVNDRNDYVCKTPDCLYFISTVDNYNVLEDSRIDIETNLLTLMRVLDAYRAMHSNAGGCFNFISSWFVYGKDSGFGDGARAISEEEQCDPKGFYSITKRCAEQLLVSYCETFGLRYRILRFANVLGSRDLKVSKKKNALQYLLREIKNSRPIELYDGGYFYRDYIDIRDCVRAIDLIANTGKINAIYNVGSGIPIIFRDAIFQAIAVSGSASEVRDIPPKKFHSKVQGSRSFFMNIDRLTHLGFKPHFTLLDSMKSILDEP